jgi:hypothetical protein
MDAGLRSGREQAMSAGEMLLEKARVELSHVFGFPSFRPG